MANVTSVSIPSGGGSVLGCAMLESVRFGSLVPEASIDTFGRARHVRLDGSVNTVGIDSTSLVDLCGRLLWAMSGPPAAGPEHCGITTSGALSVGGGTGGNVVSMCPNSIFRTCCVEACGGFDGFFVVCEKGFDVACASGFDGRAVVCKSGVDGADVRASCGSAAFVLRSAAVGTATAVDS